MNNNFKMTEAYQTFLKNNTGKGMLKIKAYTSRQATPISNVKISVTTNIFGNDVVFYEGYTDESGMIETLTLPVPKMDNNNLVAPPKIVYEINALYKEANFDKVYHINMYDNIMVYQNILIDTNLMGEENGS